MIPIDEKGIKYNRRKRYDGYIIEYQNCSSYVLFVNYARDIYIFVTMRMIKESSFLSLYYFYLFQYSHLFSSLDELKRRRFLKIGSTIDLARQLTRQLIIVTILDKQKSFQWIFNYRDILYRWARRVSLLCRNAIPLIDSHPVAVEWNFLRAREYAMDAFPSRLC